MLASMDLTLPNLALPAISADLSPSGAELLWIVDSYSFLLAGSLITMGTIGDRIGRRRLLLLGAVAFGIASLLAAYAPTAGLLIAARALLGVAGATLMPSTLSLVTAMFPAQAQRRIAIGVVIASVSGGTAVGPLIGGWLLERFWWGSVFLFALPVLAVFLVLAPFLLPEHRTGATARLDPVSILLSFAAVLPVIYGLKRLPEAGLDMASVLSIVIGLVAGVAFVRRQRAQSAPLLDLRLFRIRELSVSLATLFLGIFALWGMNLHLAQYLQLVLGLSPLEAGLWTAPSAIGVIVGSLLAPKLAQWVRPQLAVGGGLLVAAAGFLVLTRVDPAAGPWLVVLGAIVVSLGLGPMMTLSTDLVVGAAPADRVGAASALSTTAPQLGGALGIAVLGTIGALVYRSSLTLPPVPAEVAEPARETLGNAVTAADDLDGPAATALVDAAREAFGDGFQVTAAVCAVVLVATAVVMTTLHRPRRG
jgi:DHA2 family multidrug resistance protein-like MFS transporter